MSKLRLVSINKIDLNIQQHQAELEKQAFPNRVWERDNNGVKIRLVKTIQGE